MKLLHLLALLFTILSAKAQNNDSKYSAITPFIEQLRDSLNIPGVQMVITKGDSIVYIKGFGLEDIQTNKPVDPYHSRFIIGSITKTFTGVVIQKGVDQGILDKDADIAQYLDFNFDRPFDDQITLNHLLSHSAGLDDIRLAFWDGDYTNTESLKSYLKKLDIKQIRPSGELTTYSNVSYALAGYILEKASDQSVLDHYNKYIFKPLGMTNTGVIFDTRSAKYPKGYVHTPKGFELAKPYGSICYMVGSIHSTAEDMSKYMRALLSPDTFQTCNGWDGNLLSQIGQPVYSYPNTNAYSWGFGMPVIKTHHGMIYEHAGELSNFTSHMVLFQEEKTGIFVSTNSISGNILISRLIPFLLKNYFQQYDSPPIERIETILPDDLHGYYILTRYPMTKIDKLLALTYIPQCRLVQNELGNLELQWDDHIEQYIPVGNNKYTDTTNLIQRTLSFGSSLGRNVIYSTTPGIPVPIPLYQLKWFETRWFQFPFRNICQVIFLAILIFWAIRYFLTKEHTDISLQIVLTFAMISGLMPTLAIIHFFIVNSDPATAFETGVAWQITAYGFFNILFGILAIVGIVMYILQSGRLKITQKILYFLLLLIIAGYATSIFLYNGYHLVS